MSSQRYDKIINAIAGVVRRQYDRFVLPIVLLRVSVAAVLADLQNKGGARPHERREVGREEPRKRREMKGDSARAEISLNQGMAK